jgi:excisionase family DNA binding protein
VGEASQVLQMSRNTLRRLADQGAIRTYRTGGRKDRKFMPEDIAIFLLMENKGFQLNLDLVERRRNSRPGKTKRVISQESLSPLRDRMYVPEARNH